MAALNAPSKTSSGMAASFSASLSPGRDACASPPLSQTWRHHQQKRGAVARRALALLHLRRPTHHLHSSAAARIDAAAAPAGTRRPQHVLWRENIINTRPCAAPPSSCTAARSPPPGYRRKINLNDCVRGLVDHRLGLVGDILFLTWPRRRREVLRVHLEGRRPVVRHAFTGTRCGEMARRFTQTCAVAFDTCVGSAFSGARSSRRRSRNYTSCAPARRSANRLLWRTSRCV